jgi:hypothetical protein
VWRWKEKDLMVATDAAVIETHGARLTCAFDQLRGVMRDVFYRLEAAGLKPTHARAGHRALIGYEGLCEQNDPPVTTFKGIPITLGPEMAPDRLAFFCGGRLVACIANIS